MNTLILTFVIFLAVAAALSAGPLRQRRADAGSASAPGRIMDGGDAREACLAEAEGSVACRLPSAATTRFLEVSERYLRA